MTMCLRRLIIIAWGMGVLACGTSKEVGGGQTPLPDFPKHEKPVEDKETLILKAESLKLTKNDMQALKTNSLTQTSGVEKYLKLQKNYAFPIQFNGWVALDHVEHKYLHCTQGVNSEPSFILMDDHNGAQPMHLEGKIPVNLEKLYRVRLEFPNALHCQSVDIQFGVRYGTTE